MSDAARVRVLPRHVETADTFSVVTEGPDAEGFYGEFVFAIDREARSMDVAEHRALRVERGQVRDYGTTCTTPMPFDVWQRAADKLARKLGRSR